MSERDVIEEMARAMFAGIHTHPEEPYYRADDSVEFATIDGRVDFTKLARDAVAAADVAGYVLVPKEPTLAMIDAAGALDETTSATYGQPTFAHGEAHWQVMLAAAPSWTSKARG